METPIDNSTETHGIGDNWTTGHHARSKKMQKTQNNVASSSLTFSGLPILQNTSNGPVHSYFAPDDSTVRSKPTLKRFSNDPMTETTKPMNDRRRFAKLPPFKLEFEN